MQLFLDGTEQLLVLEAPQDITLAPAGVRLRLSLGPDEELVAASLTLYRFAGTSAPDFSAPVVATDSAGADPLTSFSWLTADWGGARSVRTVSLIFTSATKLKVRVQIARGASAWFSPPGPHTFVVPNGTNVTLTASFPDTVADRVMVELLDGDDGQPVTGSLAETPVITFGAHARDVTVRVVGNRDGFRHAGELPAEETAVPDLLASLRAAAGGILPGADIELELGADIAGMAQLEWSFAWNQLVRVFPDHTDTRALALPWGESVRTTLAELDGGALESVELALAMDPARQRIALAPQAAPSYIGAVALLGKPLHDNAQAFAVAPGQPLAGVDLWLRPLSSRLRMRVDICPDNGGQPGDAPIPGLTGARECTWPENQLPLAPAWLDVPLDAPALPPAGVFWLVVQVEDGEILWYLDGVRPAGAAGPRHRRNQGAWLDREASDPGAWALTRLRVVFVEPPPPLIAELVVVASGGSSSARSLILEEDGLWRWRTDTPEAAARVDLRLSTGVAAQVVMSRLRLAYRP